MALGQLFFIVGVLSAVPIASTLTADGVHLLEFKAAATDAWHVLSKWTDKSNTPCEWTGITCNEALNVTDIYLVSANLSGPISESLAKIATLQSISLGNNNFSGPIPSNIFNLTELVYLNLSYNFLQERIPSGFQNARNLQTLDFSDNWIDGELPLDMANSTVISYINIFSNALEKSIPPGIGTLTNLVYLDFSWNTLVGSIPPSLGNLSALHTLSLGNNQLSGAIPGTLEGLTSVTTLTMENNQLTEAIPAELCKLPKIGVIRLYQNQLSGSLPAQIGNLSATLLNLDISNNSLTGAIPDAIGNLTNLILFHAYFNNITGKIPAGFADLHDLEDVNIMYNSFVGELPSNMGQDQPLWKFEASGNSFSGPMPSNICGGGKLQVLNLLNNRFSGKIPPSLGNCHTLARMRIQSNMLTGGIPPSFGNLQNLYYLEVGNNNLSGPIPMELSNCSSLQTLLLNHNSFDSNFPLELGQMATLTEISVSSNFLTGELHIGNLSSIQNLDFSRNLISGQLPNLTGSRTTLSIANFSYNRFSGSIPSTYASMQNLGELDLSHNNLSGNIPVAFGSSQIQYLNVAYNNLSGPLYPFPFLNYTDYEGNAKLCAEETTWTPNLTPCTVSSPASSNPMVVQLKKLNIPLLVGILVGVSIPILCAVSLCLCYISRKFYRRREEGWIVTMFHTLPDLALEDILQSLQEDNLVGGGGSGKVYKGEIQPGKLSTRGGSRPSQYLPFVVKKLKGSVGKDVGIYDHGFRAEVETLGDIRHNHIVKLLCCCTNEDTNLLVYEYMPNGSLGDLLHGAKGGTLDWGARYKIALGAAQGLCYLHHDCSPPILHRDVKSNNILLDDNLEPRIADFGLAKLLAGGEQTMTYVVGSRGYIAPECAYSGRANAKSDVYSFGVVLLELTTGRLAVEGGDGDREDLVMWTTFRANSEEGVLAALDSRLGIPSETTRKEMALMLRIGLFCTLMNPAQRPCMRNVVRMIEGVRDKTRKQIQ